MNVCTFPGYADRKTTDMLRITQTYHAFMLSINYIPIFPSVTPPYVCTADLCSLFLTGSSITLFLLDCQQTYLSFILLSLDFNLNYPILCDILWSRNITHLYRKEA